MNEEKSTTEITESQVIEALREVYDPEIPVNIVELGLIYGCVVTPLADGGCKVEVRFTLTADRKSVV